MESRSGAITLAQMARSLPRLLALVALVGLAACGDGSKGRWVGKRPPPFATEQATWIDAPATTTWADLGGKVVYLDFGFLH